MSAIKGRHKRTILALGREGPYTARTGMNTDEELLKSRKNLRGRQFQERESYGRTKGSGREENWQVLEKEGDGRKTKNDVGLE